MSHDTLASIVRDAISELDRDCDLGKELTHTVRAGQIVRRAMDRAVSITAGNPDEDLLLEMWAGQALQGMLSSQGMGDIPSLARDALAAAEALLTAYKARRTA